MFAALVFAPRAGAQYPRMRLPPTPALPKPETSGIAPVNGNRLWYAEFGHGAPVILVHGGLANSLSVEHDGHPAPDIERP